MSVSTSLFILSTFLSALLQIVATDPRPDVTTCGSLTPSTNHTACPEFFSCCQYGWSESEGSWGCAPFPNAVCCPSRFYACPSGHTCQESGATPPWKDEVVCLPPEGAPGDDAPIRKAEEICKNGPPVLMDENRKNVIIIGDSVSIGYTPLVSESLEDIAQVIHSPWDFTTAARAMQDMATVVYLGSSLPPMAPLLDRTCCISIGAFILLFQKVTRLGIMQNTCPGSFRS
mmetsp:Transcript_1273/g.3644  ORF Transcript_1273/g.3644 Transcript_1273/m.3644 type:complete len:230 (-) Transcript_1273:2351-3040(-)